jgi:hybrid cluster-associated redox disulfide protein
MSKAISKEMSISEIVMKWPETAGTFMKHGMHCLGCAAARFESVEQGAVAHGIDPEALIEDLNDAVDSN